MYYVVNIVLVIICIYFIGLIILLICTIVGSLEDEKRL